MSWLGSVPPLFHQYFGSWLRIEPRCRSQDFSRGLEARTADPLWMLARQWQVGEFKAEDAGSPIQAEVDFQTELLESVTLGADGGTPIPLGSAPPLEALVEREEVDWDWRLRVQVGQRFERLLRLELGDDAGGVIRAYRAAYPVEEPTGEKRVEVDRATQRFLRLMAGRVVNGEELWTERDGAPPELPDGVDPSRVEAALSRLVDWFEALYTRPRRDLGSAWQSHQLDYHFRIAGEGGGRTLVAPDYRNGEFDWYSCRMDEGPDAEWPEPVTRSYTPTRVTFGGMPHRRWWAFEDHRINLGGLDVATTDLAKLMLMEFALLYGDDWFVVPFPVHAGSLVRIESLRVTDVFGHTESLSRSRTGGDTPRERWEMFTLTREGQLTSGGAGDFLFVPPVVGFREESPPVEEVRFVRDEGANMVWGLERAVRNGLGNPVDGFEAHVERHDREREWALEQRAGGDGDESTPGSDEREGTGLPRYRLATTVPPNWIPFVPATSSPFHRAIKLLRAQMLRNEADEKPSPIPALTRVLDPLDPSGVLWLEEEAVPRAGVKAQVTRQRARWVDGKTYVWLGRKAVTGRGEGSSGLRFDVVQEV